MATNAWRVAGRLGMRFRMPARRRLIDYYILLPMTILFVFVIVGIFAPLLAPHSPTEQDLLARYEPPFWEAEGSWSHPLGTDALGRDILSRMIHGARVSLTFAVVVILITGAIGTLLGLIAGYFGSWIDGFIMRLVDFTLSIPLILLAMTMVIVFGSGMFGLVLVVASLSWAHYARQIRGETLSVNAREFILAAKLEGCSWWRIIALHLFPNVAHVLIVLATLQVGTIILLEAGLSFLGIGIPPPSPSWGSMVAEGRAVLDTRWWMSVFPGAAIGLVVLSMNLFGDWLRDKLDPRLRGL